MTGLVDMITGASSRKAQAAQRAAQAAEQAQLNRQQIAADKQQETTDLAASNLQASVAVRRSGGSLAYRGAQLKSTLGG